ncbi:MAG: family 10 glycosylhydrolase [Muribaculaceae bacterium]|nr:family 10 glycosylhydrolase [Muribaculaceae bacterium]
MNNRFSRLLMAAAMAGCLSQAMAYDFTAAQPTREHRAVWFTPILSYTWPRGQLTDSNAEARKKNLVSDIAKLRDDGINCIYFHVRPNADALYFSSYEPTCSAIAGSRGGYLPFDPFEFFIETAHDAGIEVYAWVNPYRYSNAGMYGSGSELNYEVSHPDWLIINGKSSILNPGIPEVQDRIQAVISEIATNYDIDGVLFDDYFYLSSTTAADDEAQYKAYGNGKSLKDWRRSNVDETVRRSRDAVKAAKPYAVFAMGPAGRISPPNVGDYGLEAGPYGDMNYDALCADPIKWLNEGWLDFLSPQVYWHNYFDRLTDWYSVAVPHFDRHLYTSVDCSRLKDANADEYLRQIDYMRSHLRQNESGVVFFDYGAYNNYSEVYDGSRQKFGAILSQTAFQNTVLQPVHKWRGPYKHTTVSNVHRNGNTLEWNGPADAAQRRYSVYAVPADARDSFAGQREYLVGVRYTESFDISEAPDGVVYAVSVYDRYGYEYAPMFEGATAGIVAAPTVKYPTASDSPSPLFDFEWSAAPGRYVVELSDDNFETFISLAESAEQKLASNAVAVFEKDHKYQWRVRVLAPNGGEAVSAPASFTASALAITAPGQGATGVSYEPLITWTNAGNNCEYLLEVSQKRDFTTTDYVATLSEPQCQIPARTLRSGKTYYARVTASRNGTSVATDIYTFATVDRDDYAAPAILNPVADGETMHSNEPIEFEAWDGMNSVVVQISTSSDFPVRTGTLTSTFTAFETATAALGDLKISSKPLVDGQTYYVRTYGAYSLSTASGSKNTAYSPVRSFVYSSEAGVALPDADGDAVSVEGDMLSNPSNVTVSVFDPAGRSVLVTTASSTDLSPLAPGLYIIHTTTTTLKWLKK